MKKFNNWRHADGFTLVELIVVIAILAILGGVAVPAYSGYVEKAERASDEQLLAAINTAYASACLENGTDMALLKDTGASMPLAADKTVDQAGVAPYGDAFARYYAGNEASAFNVFKSIVYDGDKGMFVNIDDAGRIVLNVGGMTYVASTADIQAWKNGALGNLTGEAIAALVGGATEMIASGEWEGYRNTITGSAAFKTAASALLGGKEYDAYIEELCAAQYEKNNPGKKWADLTSGKKNGMLNTYKTSSEGQQVESNMIALVTSKNVDKASENIFDILTTSNPKETIKGNVNNSNTATLGATQSALAYGLYLSYAERNPDAEGVVKDATAQQALNRLNDEGFQKYLESDEAKADLESFKAALNVVGTQNSDTISGVVSGGFADQDLINALDQILGAK